MMQATPLAIESHLRSKRFHAHIAERAKLICQPTPVTKPAVTKPAVTINAPPAPKPPIILRADFYYDSMWFYDLVNFVPIAPERVSMDLILRTVGRYYGLSKVDIVSSRRTANIVKPRQIAMYLSKTLTLRSLPDIGRRMGNRDHTTVLHGMRKIERMLRTDQQLAGEIAEIKRMIAA